MSILPDRLQREQLRIDLGLQFEHEAHHARPEARDANGLDIRIAGLHALPELRDLAAQLDVLEVEHQTLRILHRQHLMRYRRG